MGDGVPAIIGSRPGAGNGLFLRAGTGSAAFREHNIHHVITVIAGSKHIGNRNGITFDRLIGRHRIIPIRGGGILDRKGGRVVGEVSALIGSPNGHGIDDGIPTTRSGCQPDGG